MTGAYILKNIQEDIKSVNFKSTYLLCGEEAYLKVQYKNKLLKALNPDDDTMNFNHYEGRNIDVKELIDLCETMPFFADRRVVLLEDTGFFKNKCDELADYMKELPDYLCLVFVEDEVDKRSKMYKAVKSCGRIGEFARQDEKTLMRWVLGIMKREGKQKNPNYREVCRRYLADEDDFSEELLSRLRIGKRFSNTDLEVCLEEILKEMESH